jgi:hypothetical protein
MARSRSAGSMRARPELKEQLPCSSRGRMGQIDPNATFAAQYGNGLALA